MSEQNLRGGSADEEKQLVTFYLGEEEFGFNIMSVQEIIRQPNLSKIPMAPPYVEGVANLRGIVLPIIDTRTRFGLPRVEDTDRTRVLVVDVDGNKTGLRVDRVRQVTRVLMREMEAPPPVIRSGLKVDYIENVVKLDSGKRIIMALNPSAICKIVQGEVQAKEGVSGETLAGVADLASGSDASDSVSQLVTFKLGLEEFAFSMERVREILRVERPSEVPGTPAHVLGVLTVRGNILTVIDLRVMLGLPNFESEVCGEALAVAGVFREWSERLAAAKNDDILKVDTVGSDRIRKWVSEYTTSSEALMGIVAQIRSANEALCRAIGQVSTNGVHGSETTGREEVQKYQSDVLRLIEQFHESVKANIREDQRLIVVQTHGSLLALLVDKVREVLKMPKNQIDLPPENLSDAKSAELCGIAKLDKGRRLIMLLDADKLIQETDLAQLNSRTGASCAESSQSHQVGGNGGLSTEQQFVTFRLGDGEFGIPISKIQEIDRSSKMTRIPRAAEYVDGITNLRGEVVPVINARKRFHLPSKDVDERSRVIIMELSGVKTGLLVDSVREVLNLASKDIAPPPTSISTTIERQYISGIGKVNGDKRMIVLLDVEKILTR